MIAPAAAGRVTCTPVNRRALFSRDFTSRPVTFPSVLAQLKTTLRPYAAYRALRFGWHFATDPIFRRDHLLLWRSPRNLFQHRSITLPDRYPPIFEFVRARLAPSAAAPRLLSFGCATGDEVFSLRKVFRAATIKGIDINRANIATCRARLRAAGGDPALGFEENSTAAAEPADTYDAVFCMAVFVRWQLKEDRAVSVCAPHLRFADFARTVAELARCVRPGGLLILRHSMFRFSDTATARDFTPVLALPTPEEFFPRFGPDDRRLPDAATEAVVFQKLVCPPAASPR